jgi:hypothetical protein
MRPNLFPDIINHSKKTVPRDLPEKCASVSVRVF